MTQYEEKALIEMVTWQKMMVRKPGFMSGLTKKLQQKINHLISEKIHKIITTAIKVAVKTMLKGSEIISSTPLLHKDLQAREIIVRRKIDFYKNASAAEGAVTGAGGILMGLADFPLWLSLKMKMLTEIATAYGYDVGDFKERLYILYVFQATFSSKQGARAVYELIRDWDTVHAQFPMNENDFDWQTFQQEYRDYLDIAKFFQLLPGIGAFVGAYINHKLTEQLGMTAMNAYRMRYFTNKRLQNSVV